jgi:catechol 2,3-dioxygenase-like lactoylglutathione lyase family enzyme
MAVSLTVAPAIRFHLSLNVSNLSQSVAFYRTLFGIEPAKFRADYAKFEIDDPPVVMSLEPTPRGSGGALNHLGFRMSDAASLVAMQERLERAGIHSQREEGVECCYARQTKFWVYDPDGTLWEVYTLDEDIEHRGAGQTSEQVRPARVTTGPDTLLAWGHRMGQAVPDRFPNADGEIQEVSLKGSFNMPLTDAESSRLLDEAMRVLRPGGRLFVHVLTGERTVSTDPGLPGPAAAVKYVPMTADVVAKVEKAGFEGGRLIKFDAAPCFVRNGVPMRETQLEAWKPAPVTGLGTAAIYKGPFHEVRDDRGNVFIRGRKTEVDSTTAQGLQTSEWAAQFVVLSDDNRPQH